ncbi:protein of unknown function DUF3533 [Penicillium italicum]|uniref:DUF3533 domain-containing protein n=1 Tax=Penicillium italicum TaxID=40296 RepID=A0A0A2KKR4_PENIT|nr:protein of unknown function DUF3533 [Penicillium italicum]
MMPKIPQAPKSSTLGSWKEMQTRFITATGTASLLLLILFLANMCYLYGTQFHNSHRVHNMKMLYVDYDGGVVGQAVSEAYQALKADDFPTLHTMSSGQYSTPKDVRGAVCSGDYWAAIYAAPDASTSLAASLANGTASNGSALTYIWNGARYPAFAQSEIYSNILIMVQAARSAYYTSHVSNVVAAANLSNPVAFQALLDPIQASEINIKPTTQGPRVLYNTVSLVMPIIQQFFFMMALNGISSEFQVFTKLSTTTNGLIRMVTSIVYTFLGALCMAGYIWAFKQSWDVNGNQFVLTWMITWLFMHINFLIVDFLTAFVPMQFMPFCVLTWVIMNVASSISPFELSPGFFRWGYALPAHEVYQVLVQIWSDGCQDQSYRALPILFSWWIVALSAAIYATRHRCKVAVKAHNALKELENKSDASLRPSSSSAGLWTRQRRDTIESIRLENMAYGPSYPTPGAHSEE